MADLKPFTGDLDPVDSGGAAPALQPFTGRLDGEKPRGAISEIANQLKAGTIVELPQMVGQALQYASPEGSSVGEFGREMADAATERGQRPDLQPQTDEHNVVTNALASGARMIPQSIVPAAVIGGAAAALPISPAAALVAGAAASALPTGLSQAQQTYEKAKKAGLSDEEATTAARKTGLIEAGGEAIGTYFGGKLFGLAGRPFAAAAERAGAGSAGAHALEEATGKGVMRRFLQQLPETAAVETGTEMGQNAGEAYVEQQAGIDKTTPAEAAQQAIAPTLGMTALLAPFGLAGHGIRAMALRKQADTLASGQTDPEQRAAIAQSIATEIAAADPQAAANFSDHAFNAILHAKDLTLTPDAIAQFVPATPQRAAAAPVEAPNLTTSPGAAAPGQPGGVDFERVVDTSGLSLAAEQPNDGVDFQPTGVEPPFTTSPGAAPAPPPANLIDFEHTADTSGMSLAPQSPQRTATGAPVENLLTSQPGGMEGREPLSRQMGLDPNLGPMSAAAAQAVDTGVSAAVTAGRQAKADAAAASKVKPPKKGEQSAQPQPVAPPAGASPVLTAGGPNAAAVPGAAPSEQRPAAGPAAPAAGAAATGQPAVSVDPTAQAAQIIAAHRDQFGKEPTGITVPQFKQFARQRQESRDASAAQLLQLAEQGNGLMFPLRGNPNTLLALHADPRNPGNWRTTTFDAATMQPTGHMEYNNPREAADDFLVRTDPSAAPAAPAVRPAITEAAAPLPEGMTPADVRYGMDGTPVHEGGQPFKTKPAAERARKGTKTDPGIAPQGRVVKVEGGWAIRDVTDRELAARAKSGKVLRAKGENAKYDKQPLLHWLGGLGGISPQLKGDLSPDSNPFVTGGPLFRNGGRNLDVLAANAVQDGFLPPGKENDGNALHELVSRALAGQRIAPVHLEGQVEAEALRRAPSESEEMPPPRAETEAELEARLEREAIQLADDLSLEQIDTLDALWETNENATEEDAMRALGFTEDEIRTALAQAVTRQQEAGGAGRVAAGAPAEVGAPQGAQAGPSPQETHTVAPGQSEQSGEQGTGETPAPGERETPSAQTIPAQRRAEKTKKANEGKSHPTVQAADAIGQEFGMSPDAAPGESPGSKKAGKGYGSWKTEANGWRISISAGSPGNPTEKINLIRTKSAKNGGIENINRDPDGARAALREWVGQESAKKTVPQQRKEAREALSNYIVPEGYEKARPWMQTERTGEYAIAERAMDRDVHLSTTPGGVNYYQGEGGNENTRFPSLFVHPNGSKFEVHDGGSLLPGYVFDTKEEAIAAAKAAIRKSIVLSPSVNKTEVVYPKREALGAIEPELLAGTTEADTKEIADAFSAAEYRAAHADDGAVTHVLDAPAAGEVVRLQDKVRIYHRDHGWMSVAEAKKRIDEWEAHAVAQAHDRPEGAKDNNERIVLSLFDLTGKWSLPWEQAGYQVYRFDIQSPIEVETEDGETINAADINNFSVQLLSDLYGMFDGKDVHAILAAVPCTDFASSGARHFAMKDADGRTVDSIKLVHATLETIEYFKPSVWAIENPVGRIEKLGGLPPWRLSFDPNHLGDPYTKKTLLWGRFNADLPVAPVEPTEGSKMHAKFGGKSQKTKNARSQTPEGFAYGFFMANNAFDHLEQTLAWKYDRLDRAAIKAALDAGATEEQIENAVDDHYYMDLDDEAANAALRELAGQRADLAGAAPSEGQQAAHAARVQREEAARQQQQAAPGPDGFELGQQDINTGNDVSPKQDKLFEPTAAYNVNRPAPVTRTPQFKAWFGKSVVTMNGKPGGRPRVVFHGTIADFSTFERERSNIESDWGAGFYFSNTPEDVANNYAGEGPDTTSKLARESERIADSAAYDKESPEAEQVAEVLGVDPADLKAAPDDDFQRAVQQIARERIGVEHGGATMPVYLSIQNPVIYGGPNETFLDGDLPYDEENEEYGTPAGKLAEFAQALRDVASRYEDGSVDGAMESLDQMILDGGEKVSKVIEAVTDSPNFSYYTDENGNIASNEIIRQALEKVGFDGIVDNSVDTKFGSQRGRGVPMKGMTKETVHYIVFQPEQVKSAIGNSGAFSKTEANITREPEAAYAGAYETDLFGNPVPAPAGKRARGQRAPAEGGDVQPAAAIQDTPAPPAEYYVNTIVGHTEQRRIGAPRVTTPTEAAQATQYLYKSAVERFDAIVTDAAGKPLAIVGNFKGDRSQTSVYPAVVVGEALRVPGAANIWLSHNHPSGSTQLSRADEALTNTMARVFEGTGIKVKGIIAVAGGKFSFGTPQDGMQVSEQPIPQAQGIRQVPVIERQLQDDRQAPIPLSSPEDAKLYGAQFYERTKTPGILMLDAQNRIAGWMPLPEEMRGELIPGNKVGALFRAMGQSNATAAVIVHGGELDGRVGERRGPPYARVENIAAALVRIDVRPLDAIDVKRNISLAEKGVFPPGGDAVFSLSKAAGPAWRSELTEAVANAPIKNAAKPASWLQWLKSVEGKTVKPDEIFWTGLREWLQLQGDRKITPDEVSSYLRENGVQVQTVVKGKQAKTSEADRFRVELDALGFTASENADGVVLQRRSDGMRFVYDGSWDAFVHEDDREQDAPRMLEEGDDSNDAKAASLGRKLDAVTVGDEYVDPHDNHLATRYEKYALPGGENYREVLLTLPTEAERAEVTQQPDGLWYIRWPDGTLSPHGRTDRKFADAALRFAVARDKSGGVSSRPPYRSSHWDEPNVLAHIRLNDRTTTEPFTEQQQADIRTRAAMQQRADELAKKIGQSARDARIAGDIRRENLLAELRPLVRAGKMTPAEMTRRLDDAAFSTATDSVMAMQRERDQLLRDMPPEPKPVTKRVLFVEELQSDWAQAGRKQGFRVTPERESELRSVISEAERAGKDATPEQKQAWVAAMNELQPETMHSKPPSAPFVDKTDSWVTLALKKIMQMAATEGYDRVAFVNGEQSADRYDLSKHVSVVKWETSASTGHDGKGTLTAIGPHNQEVMSKEMAPTEIEDHVGKEVAKRLLEAPLTAEGEGRKAMAVRRLSGVQLRVGGEGMKSFYDKIVPKNARHLLKKLGGELRELTLRRGELDMGEIKYTDDHVQPGFDVTDAMREEAKRGMAMFRQTQQAQPEQHLSHPEILEAVSKITGSWLRKPAIYVIDDMSEAPPSVYRSWQAQQSRLEGEPEGFHWRGEVYLLAPFMRDAATVQRVLFHESLGHFGLRGVFGNRLNPMLAQFAAQRPELVAAKAKEYRLDLNNREQRLLAAEEALAELAQDHPELTVVQRLIAAIKGWLREHGLLSGQMSDAEIVSTYILPARGFVERAKAALPDFGHAPQYSSRGITTREVQVDGKWRPIANSRGQLIVPDHDGAKLTNFWRWFGDSKVVDEQGRPMVVYHGTGASEPIKKFIGNTFAGWFAADPKRAAAYTEASMDKVDFETGVAEDAAIYPTYLVITNPLDLSALNADDKLSLTKIARAMHTTEKEVRDIADGADRLWELIDSPNFREWVQASGHDGVKIMEGNSMTWATMRPEQIKSATGNNGEFSPESSDLRFSLTRRSFVIGSAAALAANPAQAETALGRAKALSPAVMNARLPKTVEKLLVGNGYGTTNLQGAKAIKQSLETIAASGPQEVRALAAQIAQLVPESGIAVQVDRGDWTVHGAVEMEPLVRLRLMDGKRSRGMTYDTFLHESLHAIVAARYRSLSVGMARSNDALIGIKAPAASRALEQFHQVWEEFSNIAFDDAVAAKARGDESDLALALREAASNPDEFFVRSLTDPTLQAWMATREYKGRTLWERFKSWIKTSLFGMKEEGARPSWLDAALLASDDLVRAMSGDKPDFQRLRAIEKASARKTSSIEPQRVFASAVALGNIRQRAHTPEQLRAMRNTGLLVQPKTLAQRYKDLTTNMGKRIAQGMVDQFRPMRDISHEAYELLRMSKGASGAFEVLLKGGQLKIEDGIYDFDTAKRGGVLERLLMPLQGEHHDFFRYVAANRAEHLSQLDREHLFSPQDIADLKTLADGTTDFDYTLRHGPQAGQVTRNRRRIYDDSLHTLREFNKNTLDMAEQSGLFDAASRQYWEELFYVPFYRVFEDGVRGMNITSGVVRQQAFKHLKGGVQHLNEDLLENTLMNWAHLLEAAAKNRAAKASLEALVQSGNAIEAPEEVVRQMSKSIGRADGVVWFQDGAVKRHFFVDDPYLMTAISALEFAGFKSPAMKALGAFKHALTRGVTLSPYFKVRNLIRDSVQAIASGPLSYNVAQNLLEGWRSTGRSSDQYMSLLASGATIHFGTQFEGSEAKRLQALVEAGVDKSTVLNGPHAIEAFYHRFVEPAVSAYEELGNRGEAVNRAALYLQLRRQGAGHREAALQARDLMDFSMQGSWTTIRFLTQVVPFMNARLQGLYKLGRAAQEDPFRFGAVLGATTLASWALMAAFHDDDDWKKREDWDRNNYWWFKFGGTAFRIPKPFEIGAIASLAERSAEWAFDDEMTANRFRQNVLMLAGDNLSLNPIPQLVKPMLDVYANIDGFTGRPIETAGMERLLPTYRYTQETSMLARGASSGINAVTGLVGQQGPSPVQIDHLIRGYFSWAGAFAVGASDALLRPITGQPDRPASDLFKAASGGMVAQTEGAPSRYVSAMYQQAKEIEQAFGTWRELVRSGKVDEASEFQREHAAELRRYHRLEQVKRAQGVLNEQRRRIEAGPDDAQVKQERILEIRRRQDALARSVTQPS